MSPRAVARLDPADPSVARGEDATGRAARHALREALHRRLVARVGPDDALWFEDCLAAVAESDPVREPRTFDLALALAPERLGGEPLHPAEPSVSSERSGETCAAACRDTTRAPRGFGTACRSIAGTARALLVTAAGDDAAPTLLARALRQGSASARLELFRALPLLPCDDIVVDLVREGLGTGRRDVLESIAHANPWPARHLGESDWNRLVLGALFVGSALAPIHALDERAGPSLTKALVHHALARHAAARPVPVDLWRALGPFATRAALAPFLPGRGALDAPWPDDATHAALARAVIRSRDPALAALARRLTRRRARLVGIPSSRVAPAAGNTRADAPRR